MKLFFHISLIIVLVGCSNSSGINTVGPMETFPDFSVQNSNGLYIPSIAKEIKKGPFVVFVFDPDCPYCQKQTRDLIENSELLKTIHIYMITIAPFNQMANFYKDFKLDTQPNITLWRDSGRFTLKFFKLQAVPFTAIYNKNHFLDSTFNGMVNTKTIVNVISQRN